MTVDERMERLYQQVELVRGAGDRKRGRLCVMSFVAFLVGEHHTDNPCTASGVIRRFAMTINDDMPNHLRQRLKCFAPRIIGTRDGQDRSRAELLLFVARSEILPRISEDFTECAGSQRASGGPRPTEDLHDLLEKLHHAMSRARSSGAWEELASAWARLVSHCARNAATLVQRDWYWLKSIEVLDRLCDIGTNRRRPDIATERLASLEAFLDRRAEMQQRRTRAAAVLARVRTMIPGILG